MLCIDDNHDMTAALRIMIDAEPMMQCVGCLASANDLVNQIRRINPPPRVVLLDATMRGKNPFDALSELAKALPEVRTIIFSGHDDAGFVGKAMNAGAWGCISKREDPHTVMQAVRDVAAGKVCWPGRGKGR